MSKLQVTLNFLNLMTAHNELSLFEFRNFFFSSHDSIFQYHHIFAFLKRVLEYILLSTSNHSIVEPCLQLFVFFVVAIFIETNESFFWFICRLIFIFEVDLHKIVGDLSAVFDIKSIIIDVYDFNNVVSKTKQHQFAKIMNFLNVNEFDWIYNFIQACYIINEIFVVFLFKSRVFKFQHNDNFFVVVIVVKT